MTAKNQLVGKWRKETSRKKANKANDLGRYIFKQRTNYAGIYPCIFSVDVAFPEDL